MPKQIVYCFYGYICDFLEFPSVKSSNIFTTHRFQRDTNFKDEKSRGWNGSLLDFLRNFADGNARKSTVSFAFCAYADVIKYLPA